MSPPRATAPTRPRPKRRTCPGYPLIRPKMKISFPTLMTSMTLTRQLAHQAARVSWRPPRTVIRSTPM